MEGTILREVSRFSWRVASAEHSIIEPTNKLAALREEIKKLEDAIPEPDEKHRMATKEMHMFEREMEKTYRAAQELVNQA